MVMYCHCYACITKLTVLELEVQATLVLDGKKDQLFTDQLEKEKTYR